MATMMPADKFQMLSPRLVTKNYYYVMIRRLPRRQFLFSLGAALCVSTGLAREEQPASATIKTSLGNLVLTLDWAKAPENCASFVRYVKQGIYAQTSFDELDDMALFGGKPTQKIAGVASNGNMDCNQGPVGEFQLPNKRGFVGFRRTVGSCNPDKRSNCTQIYVRFKDNPASDGQFTIFAVIDGDLQLVDAIHGKLLKRESVPFSVELSR